MEQELIWKLLSLLCEDRGKEDANLPKLLNVGSCGLHVVHAALCIGCQATDWKKEGLLKVLSKLIEAKWISSR